MFSPVILKDQNFLLYSKISNAFVIVTHFYCTTVTGNISLTFLGCLPHEIQLRSAIMVGLALISPFRYFQEVMLNVSDI